MRLLILSWLFVSVNYLYIELLQNTLQNVLFSRTSQPQCRAGLTAMFNITTTRHSIKPNVELYLYCIVLYVSTMRQATSDNLYGPRKCTIVKIVIACAQLSYIKFCVSGVTLLVQKQSRHYELKKTFLWLRTTELKVDRMENSINGSRYRHILHYCGGCARPYGPGPLSSPQPPPTPHLHNLLSAAQTPVC